jgi:diguanylate cyclase (GGDEF)-like protein
MIATMASRIRSTNKLISENAVWVQELRHQIHMDKLTGLYNDSYLSDEVRRLLDTGGSEPLAVMNVKPDNFKAINDTYGHEAGDEALKLMAATLQRIALPGESAVRFRGNELSLLMPQTDADAAARRAGEVHAEMSAVDVSEITGNADFALSLSVGLAISTEWSDGGEASTKDRAEKLIQTAHERAYAARESGGNTVRDWS